MKKFLLIFSILTCTYTANAQDCKKREELLIGSLGAFTAGYLYNTYGLVGSVSDGFINEIYNPKMTADLLNPQKKVLASLGGLLDSLIRNGIMSEKEEKEHVDLAKSIFNGLNRQIDLMLEYVRSKTPQRLEAYEEQRKKNWSDISRMMGIDD